MVLPGNGKRFGHYPAKEVVLMNISIIDLIGALFAVFTAGIAIGRCVEKISSFISEIKNDRHSRKD